jgi:hypothetical protein
VPLALISKRALPDRIELEQSFLKVCFDGIENGEGVFSVVNAIGAVVADELEIAQGS